MNPDEINPEPEIKKLESDAGLNGKLLRQHRAVIQLQKCFRLDRIVTNNQKNV